MNFDFRDVLSKITPKQVKELHTRDDVDAGSLAHHHTLGFSAHQAAPGGATLKKLDDLDTRIGDINTVIDSMQDAMVRIGDMVPSGRTDESANFKLCNGQQLLAADYPELDAVLGSSEGLITLPDMKDRFPLGADGTPGKSIHETGGSDSVTLVEANLPPHKHSFPIKHAANTTSTSTTIRVTDIDNLTGAGGTSATAFTSNGNGTSTSFSTKNKYRAVNYFIRVK